MSQPSAIPANDDLISIGRLTQLFGMYGGVKFRPAGDPEHLRGIKQVWLEDFGWQKVRRLEAQGDASVLYLGEFKTRQASDVLRGLEVFANKSDVRLPEGVYFYHDLIGLPVVAPDGSSLGVVKSLIDVSYSDILVVLYNGRDVLVPVQAPYVRLLEGKIEIEPIAGLFHDE